MGTNQKKSRGKNTSIQGKPAKSGATKRQAVAIRLERCEHRMKLGITVEGKFSPPRLVAAFILVIPMMYSGMKAIFAAVKELVPFR